MCGIVGYIGNDKALPKLLSGLRILEYRGYDSAGVAYVDSKQDIKICKAIGRVDALAKKLNLDEETYMGIGHTRWATHGGVSEVNSHPHQVGKVTIVHNGILENYGDIKRILIEKGYCFRSETDSEILAGYIDYLYDEYKDIVLVLEKAKEIFVGSFSVLGMVEGLGQQLFVMKKDSPLVVARGKDGNYVASDVMAYGKDIIKYFALDDGMIGIISDEDIKIYQNKMLIRPNFLKLDMVSSNEDIGNFDTYMLKEINAQKELVNTWYNNYFLNNDLERLVDINNYDKIQIVGCGTAYHAGMVGKYLLEYYGNREVNVFIASEYRYQKLFIDNKTLVIFISQSGETADTIACIKMVKEIGGTTLGIVNVENSSIARCVDSVIYTKAGREVAVASTKAYTAQVYVLSMLALRSSNKYLNDKDIKNSYFDLSYLIRLVLDYDYSPIIELIYKKNSLFYIGRNIDYVTMMEGSLKLKEITYIHSEAMMAGELKHGTISLMDDSSVVVAMATLPELVSKTISNIKEVKARGASVILFIREDLSSNIDRDICDIMIKVPKTSYIVQPIINTVYLQMIAYNLALKLGRDIDKPRNLAKSVTVE